jgi:catechol 2,3-dioxygenase-like lactoylglutathione lyase family enzyme
MRPAGILETALYTSDLDAAQAFYGGLLGLPVLGRLAGRHVFFGVGAGVLLVFDPSATERPAHDPALPVPVHGARGPGHVCFAASSEEIAGWRERLVAAGVEIESEFDWPNGARSLYVRDPAGNSVEFAEPRLWER